MDMAQKQAAENIPSNGTAANLGFEAKLWLTADKLRNNMDAAEYKHVVLGLIFLKYISDAFEERHQKLLTEVNEGADPEDPDEYRADMKGGRKNDEGRSRSQGAHRAVCTANHPVVWEPTKDHGSAGARQASSLVLTMGST